MGDRTINVAPGATYIEHQENHFHDQSRMFVGDPKTWGKEDEEQEETEDEELVDGALVDDLLKFFYNDRDEVERFVARVRDARPMDVTAAVNELVRKRKISDISCKKPLWAVLHRHKLYEKQYSNWSKQVKIV